MNNRLDVRNLNCHHLKKVSLSVAPAECVCIQGPSGAGKSLLLRAICDIEPNTGEVRLDNQLRDEIPATLWRRQVGMLPAESHWWHDTVGEHFTDASEASLAPLGMPAQAMQWSVARLSSGERQRLAVARLLQNRPKVLLLDEPTANLDAANRTRLEELLCGYGRKAQAALIWVSHDSDQIRRVADRLLTLASGQLRAREIKSI